MVSAKFTKVKTQPIFIFRHMVLLLNVMGHLRLNWTAHALHDSWSSEELVRSDVIVIETLAVI